MHRWSFWLMLYMCGRLRRAEFFPTRFGICSATSATFQLRNARRIQAMRFETDRESFADTDTDTDTDTDANSFVRRADRATRRASVTQRLPVVSGKSSRVQSVNRVGMPVCAVSPPSATKAAPVTYDARSDARNSTTLAISSGRPKRPIGMAARVASAKPGMLKDR